MGHHPLTRPARPAPAGSSTSGGHILRRRGIWPPGGRQHPHGGAIRSKTTVAEGLPRSAIAVANVRRLALPAVAFAIYVSSIAGANWMIAHVGRSATGAHVLPVGFGLEAPSGVYLAGLTFVARDIVQRLAGTKAGLAAILLGALVSWTVSTASLAMASGATFLLSESCDFAVYTPLQRRHFPLAVLGSGLVSDAVDSTVFLTLAGIPLSVALPGQLVGKAWLVLAGALLAALLRRAGPFKSPAPR